MMILDYGATASRFLRIIFMISDEDHTDGQIMLFVKPLSQLKNIRHGIGDNTMKIVRNAVV